MNTLKLFSALILGILLSGCAQKDKSDSFAEVIPDKNEPLETTYTGEVISESEEAEVTEETEETEESEDIEEEILNTIRATEILIVDDDAIPEDEAKTREELEETETAFGSTDFSDGTDDVTVVRDHKDEVVEENKQKRDKDSNFIYTAVDLPPVFPGGPQAMYEWILKNMRYPEIAAQNKVQGRVTVQFVVEKDGSIGEVKVVRGRDRDLDAEAVRLVKSMPKFEPGKMNGQVVRVWYTLPINFSLKSH